MIIKNHLWLLPFISFFTGYLLFRSMHKTDYIDVPPLVGLCLQEACCKATNARLTIRLGPEKEDPNLPEGTVISQAPTAGARLKPHQAIFLTVSKKPAQDLAPDIREKSIEAARDQLHDLNIRAKTYSLATSYPANQCIGQLPSAGTKLSEAKMLIYVSSGNQKPVIMPNYKNMLVTDVKAFLANYPVTVKVAHEFPQLSNHLCTHCIVNDQRPLAGSLITLDREKPITIHLQVSANAT